MQKRKSARFRLRAGFRSVVWGLALLAAGLSGCSDGAVSDGPPAGQGGPNKPGPNQPNQPNQPAPMPIVAPVFSVSKHTFPDDDREQTLRDLDLVAGLGAKMVRTDFWWFSVEPQRDQIDPAALDHFEWFVRSAAERGIGVIGVLSNPPDWAKSIYASQGVSAYADRFRNYVAAVAERVAPMVTYYQLSNEINHPAIDMVQNDLPVLRAAKQALALRDPEHVTIVNVLVDGHNSPTCPNWYCDLEGYMKNGASPDVDILAIDYYPDTWSVFQDWNGDVLNRLFLLGKQYGKRVAIMETGYSTKRCVPIVIDRSSAQMRYAQNFFDAISKKIVDPRITAGVPLVFVNWYELEDKNTGYGNCLAGAGVEVIESHFGLVNTDRTRKPGYEAVRKGIEAVGATVADKNREIVQ